LTQNSTPIAVYLVYVPLVVYAMVYTWNGAFINSVFERLIFGLGEVIGIAIYSLYLFDITVLIKYDLDFIGLAVILLLDFINYFMRLIGRLCFQKPLDGNMVAPI
jgi:hypothetical protein